MAWTDIAVLIIITILVANGAYQGFLRSLLGPLSVIIGSAIGYFVFLATHHIITGLLITLLGPILLLWGLNWLIFQWLGEVPTQIMFLSRIGGAAVKLLWGGSILALTLLLLALLPLQDPRLNAIRQDMNASQTYRLLEKITFGKEIIPNPGSDCPTSTCGMSKADLDALAADPDVKNILADERVQTLLNDPVIREAIKKKDFAQLLSNPSITALAQDPQFLKEVITVYPKFRAKTSH